VQGQAQWFLDGSVDEVSGWVIRVRLDIISQRNLCDMPMGNYDFDGTFISLCAPVKIFENGIFKESIEAGGSFFYNTGGVCLPANYVVEYESGTLIEEGTIESGGSKTIIVPDCPPPEPCADGTVNVQQSDATLISAVTVASGGTAPYLVADSVITLNDTTPTLISTTNVKATDNATIVAPDGVVTITDTTPTTLHTVNVKSNGIASQQISDSTVNVQKSDNTLIAAVSVKAQGTEPYQVADSIVNVNAVKLADVKATDTLSISVVDSLDAAVSVTLSGGNKIIVDDLPCSGGVTYEGANPLKSGLTASFFANDDGATERGRGTDHFNLASNNPFGNLKRFTGITGGYQSEIDSLYYDKDGVATTEALAFPDDWVIDWQTYNGGSFLWYRRTPESSTADYTGLMNGQPYTSGGYDDLYVANIREMQNIQLWNSFGSGNQLNFQPFNYLISAANATRIGTSSNDGSLKWCLNNVGGITTLSVTQNLAHWLVRYGTLANLGL
jgi:VCBS repeat-containing protein